ncbi:MAG: hypothetical protein H8D23_10910 [Candidatus Brocadiales bacterium]|nr:hypothetical protein [Candidatus Brocadiales bacterium]
MATKTTLKTQRTNKNIDKAEINPLTGGLVLRSTWRGKIAGQTTKEIKSGLAVQIPDGYYGVITNSDNLIRNYQFLVRPQLVTAGDRDEITLFIVNYRPYPELISLNQVVAELVLHPIEDIDLKPVPKIGAVKTEE